MNYFSQHLVKNSTKTLYKPYTLKKLVFLAFLFFCTFICNAETLIIEPDMGRTPVLSAISKAKSSVDMVMYGLTDTTLINSLIDAKKSGKEVKVLLQKFPYKNDNENRSAIKALQQANIPLKWPNPDFKLTHQKTLVMDHKNALVMTFNFTQTTFKNQRNFGLLIDDPSMVNEIEHVFNHDWEYQNSFVHHPNLVWSPNNSRDRLLQFISQAQSTIQIYAQSITDYKTLGALAKAAKNGAKVEILTSSNFSTNSKKYDYLQHAGVIIYYSKNYYIHAKVIIVDHHSAMIGSMNLTKPSIEDNRELSIITQDKKVIQQLESTFNQDIHSASNDHNASSISNNHPTSNNHDAHYHYSRKNIEALPYHAIQYKAEMLASTFYKKISHLLKN